MIRFDDLGVVVEEEQEFALGGVRAQVDRSGEVEGAFDGDRPAWDRAEVVQRFLRRPNAAAIRHNHLQAPGGVDGR